MGVWLIYPPSLHLAQEELREVEEDPPMPSVGSFGLSLLVVDTSVEYKKKFITGGNYSQCHAHNIISIKKEV